MKKPIFSSLLQYVTMIVVICNWMSKPHCVEEILKGTIEFEDAHKFEKFDDI